MYGMRAYVRPRILEANGLKMSDFDDEQEAFKLVDDLLQQNCKDFDFEPQKLDHPNPMLVRFKYVIGHGTKRRWSSVDKTSLHFSTVPKTNKGLADMGAVAALIAGDVDPQKPGEAENVKVESPKFEEMTGANKQLRSPAPPWDRRGGAV